jgi:hypothetical protein
MNAGEREPNPGRINRREALKRTAIVTGVAWTAPVVMSMRSPAFAQSPPGCEEGCRYVIQFQEPPPYTCSRCERDPGCGHSCTGQDFCAGPGCARITSLEKQDGFVRFCTDCQLQGGETVCETCPPGVPCACSGPYPIDPNDPRCGIVFVEQFQCEGKDITIYFRCAAC